MLAAQYDLILFMDADLSTPIEEALPLSIAIHDGVDVAIASRKPQAGKKVERISSRKLMATVFRLLIRILVLRGFYDTQCGFKMFRRSCAHQLFSLQCIERWGFDVELLYIARKKGFRIKEIPVSWRESNESKLKWITPVAMASDLLRVRWHDLLGRYGGPRKVNSIQRCTSKNDG